MKTALIVRNLTHCYETKKAVLKSIRFSVSRGEFFVIIGPNGSGKSTLLKAICGALNPREGEVEVFGRSVRACTKRELARHIALTPQSPPLDIPFTVAEVVLMGRSPHLGLLSVEKRTDREIAMRSMAYTAVEHLAARRLGQLSAGEVQRVFIARAICQQPGIMVLDEPTASLDPAHQVQVMNLLEGLRHHEGTTVIMVSHDLNLSAMYADRLLLLKEGSVVSVGSPREVLTAETLESAYGCSFLVDSNPADGAPRTFLVRRSRAPG